MYSCRLINGGWAEAATGGVLQKKVFLKISQIEQENSCVRVSFQKSYRPQASDFIKKRLQHSCFPMKFAKFLRTPILKNISERLLLEGLFSLLFYCESGINQYAVQKTLTDVFGASLLLLELSCLRYFVLLHHLRILRVFMRIRKSFVQEAECEIYLSRYN